MPRTGTSTFSLYLYTRSGFLKKIFATLSITAYYTSEHSYLHDNVLYVFSLRCSIWCFMAICAFFVSSYNRTSLSLLNPFSYSVFTHSSIQRLSKKLSTSNTWMPLASSPPFFTEFIMALITNRLSRISRPFLPPILLSVRFLSTSKKCD